MPKRWIPVLLIGMLFIVSHGETDDDVAIAQARKPVVVTRIFTGPDGLSHAEDIELKLNARGVADVLKATGAEFSARPPSDSNAAAWHTGPSRQLVITLSGSSEVEVSGGVHVSAGPGHINLIEDTTGKGHITRNFGPEDRVALTITLADGVVIDGTRTARSPAGAAR
jgi:hypothetical protein